MNTTTNSLRIFSTRTGDLLGLESPVVLPGYVTVEHEDGTVGAYLPQDVVAERPTGAASIL